MTGQEELLNIARRLHVASRKVALRAQNGDCDLDDVLCSLVKIISDLHSISIPR